MIVSLDNVRLTRCSCMSLRTKDNRFDILCCQTVGICEPVDDRNRRFPITFIADVAFVVQDSDLAKFPSSCSHHHLTVFSLF